MSLADKGERLARSDRSDKLLVGLGNPGPKYAATRHNFGFLLLDRVSQLLSKSENWQAAGVQEQAGLGRWEQFQNSERRVHLLWPLTFMNLSGQALERVLEALPSSAVDTRKDLLVAIDDLSLPLGRVRLRAKGSPGGHNGLKSVEAHLGHDQYSRLKLGIGRPEGSEPVVDFVLEPFSQEELATVQQVLDFVALETIRWLEGAQVPELSQEINGWSANASSPEEGCSTKQ